MADPTPPADPSTEPTPLFRGLVLFALYAIPVLVTVQPVGVPVFDPDIWWHLRVGGWVVEHGAVPANDPFSQYGQDRPWVAYSWLYEVLVYLLHDRLGLYGIILYRVVGSLLVVAALHSLVRSLRADFLTTAGLTLAGTLAVQPLLYERPWLFTILFTTLTLHAVLAFRRADEGRPLPRWVWALPLVYVLWASIHIQFLYGIVVLGLGCLAPLFDRALELPAPPSGTAGVAAGSRRWRQLVGLSAVCLLATLVNPYHVRLYAVVAEYVSYPGAFLWVNELRAPEFREAATYIMLALTLAATFCLGRRRPLGSFEVLLLAGTAFLAFRARRDIWFVVLADLVILAEAASASSEEEAPAPRARVRPVALGVVGLAALALVVGWARGLTPRALDEQVATRFPVEAARVIRERGYSGPLFNYFNWGGYLIWALPEMPVAIDGRTNLHGDERLERFGQTWSGLPGWEKNTELTEAGVVIAGAESPLASLLLLERGRFELVYSDDVARVFVARRQAAAALSMPRAK